MDQYTKLCPKTQSALLKYSEDGFSILHERVSSRLRTKNVQIQLWGVSTVVIATIVWNDHSVPIPAHSNNSFFITLTFLYTSNKCNYSCFPECFFCLCLTAHFFSLSRMRSIPLFLTKRLNSNLATALLLSKILLHCPISHS